MHQNLGSNKENPTTKQQPQEISRIHQKQSMELNQQLATNKSGANTWSNTTFKKKIQHY
jgi:hypothetical protein